MTEEAPEIFEGLREQRLEGILSDLSKWAAEPIEFAFDPRGTHLYSIEEAKRAYTKRYLALHGSARRLLDDDVVSASVLGRAIIETIAMGVFFVDEMERLVVAGNLENLERRVSRFLVGDLSPKFPPVLGRVLGLMFGPKRPAFPEPVGWRTRWA